MWRKVMSQPNTPASPPLPTELDERERQLNDDYEWCLHDAEVQRRYAGLVVAAHMKTVWGSGKTHGEAIRDAQAKTGCPPREALAKVYIEGLE
jgi:hypothetical protein